MCQNLRFFVQILSCFSIFHCLKQEEMFKISEHYRREKQKWAIISMVASIFGYFTILVFSVIAGVLACLIKKGKLVSFEKNHEKV